MHIISIAVSSKESGTSDIISLNKLQWARVTCYKVLPNNLFY